MSKLDICQPRDRHLLTEKMSLWQQDYLHSQLSVRLVSTLSKTCSWGTSALFSQAQVLELEKVCCMPIALSMFECLLCNTSYCTLLENRGQKRTSFCCAVCRKRCWNLKCCSAGLPAGGPSYFPTNDYHNSSIRNKALPNITLDASSNETHRQNCVLTEW